MPEIKFYMDHDHYGKYRELDNETKSKINTKARQLIYRELDKLK